MPMPDQDLTPEQTRDIILTNLTLLMPPDKVVLFSFILGLQMGRIEPRLALAIEEATLVAQSEDKHLAAVAGIEQAMAELRDSTKL